MGHPTLYCSDAIAGFVSTLVPFPRSQLTDVVAVLRVSCRFLLVSSLAHVPTPHTPALRVLLFTSGMQESVLFFD